MIKIKIAFVFMVIPTALMAQRLLTNTDYHKITSNVKTKGDFRFV